MFELKDKLRFISNSEAGFPLADLLHCSLWQAQKYQDCFCIYFQVNMLMCSVKEPDLKHVNAQGVTPINLHLCCYRSKGAKPAKSKSQE